MKAEDKKFLLELSQALRLAEPIGNHEDNPEGSGIIEWSLTLARMVSMRLEGIANDVVESGGSMLVTSSFRANK